MYIEKIILRDFGKLTGEVSFKADKINVICQDNEFGKTTLMDAVLYALYNFPPGRGRQGELRPRDRYKPWNTLEERPNAAGFGVELHFTNPEGRRLRLVANFNRRQQPFSLYDNQTLAEIPLDGLSYGQRYFRMSQSSFTECFFFRQDERDNQGRNELIEVIEAAAASNRREQPAGVSQAIRALADAQGLDPQFTHGQPVKVNTLLSRIRERMEVLQRQMADLEAERDKFAPAQEEAQRMEKDIADKDRLIEQLQWSMLNAEVDDLQGAVALQDRLSATVASRRRRLEELEPYRGFDPGKRTGLQSLFSQWDGLVQEVESARNRLESELESQHASASAAMEEYPASMDGFGSEELEKLRQVETALSIRRANLAEETERLNAASEVLEREGISVDQATLAVERLQSLPEVDRNILLKADARQKELATLLEQAEENAEEARVASGQAKARRDRVLALRYGVVAMGAAGSVFALVMILASNTPVGLTLAILTLALAALGYYGLTNRLQQLLRDEVKPATELEVSIGSETRKLRDESEGLTQEFDAVRERHGITEEELTHLLQAEQWSARLAPWRAAHDACKRLEAQCKETFREAVEHVSRTRGPNDTATLDDHSVTVAIQTGEAYLAAKRKLEESEARLNEARERLEHQSNRLQQVEVELSESLRHDAIPDDAPLKEKLNVYLNGCDKAQELQILLAESGGELPWDEDRIVREKVRLEELCGRLDAMLAERPYLGTLSRTDESRSDLQATLERLRRQREQSALDRVQLFQQSDRAVDAWREQGPRIQEELISLEARKKDLESFGAAMELARAELAEIADQVFSQWATAINDRVNDILPHINPRYREIACSRDLELSAYSYEAGRRLDARELQHLSKGARDQLFMALRVAISEYLSSHVGNLPLVFDEAFAHWDDQRFVEGLRFMKELSTRHQVILLSCHKWRYDRLQESEPELWQQIEFCSLAPIDETGPARVGRND